MRRIARRDAHFKEKGNTMTRDELMRRLTALGLDLDKALRSVEQVAKHEAERIRWENILACARAGYEAYRAFLKDAEKIPAWEEVRSNEQRRKIWISKVESVLAGQPRPGFFPTNERADVMVVSVVCATAVALGMTVPYPAVGDHPTVTRNGSREPEQQAKAFPTFNHTRGDGPMDPCPECLALLSREQLLAYVQDLKNPDNYASPLFRSGWRSDELPVEPCQIWQMPNGVEIQVATTFGEPSRFVDTKSVERMVMKSWTLVGFKPPRGSGGESDTWFILAIGLVGRVTIQLEPGRSRRRCPIAGPMSAETFAEEWSFVRESRLRTLSRLATDMDVHTDRVAGALSEEMQERLGTSQRFTIMDEDKARILKHYGCPRCGANPGAPCDDLAVGATS